METILSILSGGIGGAVCTWLLRNWISERIKQSIKHEYAQKLENHKAELNVKMQSVIYERQLHQLRTSLFFDHQREAFASILNQLSEIITKWWEVAGNSEESFIEPIPHDEYEKFKRLFYQHQLFFDSDCLLVIGMAIKAMSDSFSGYDELCGQPHVECREPYDRLGFIYERMAQIFQEKIGASSDKTAKKEIALLALIKLLNSPSLSDTAPPIIEPLSLEKGGKASEAVLKAQQHEDLLISIAREFKEYLAKNGFLHEEAVVVDRCLKILSDFSDVQPRNQ